ncbi:hypothetical protein ACHHYP_12193 [Achlya hypogyna]|uniref:Tc1-like transposase DDE domain-containing protein n=1 Tax=Achlya hypogyna TaxID=1202772 RepID=A0A1V9YHE1_ACHHY|nr:hypothetical protein ACHHYP_12193 [Achlya hypogyna]
MLPPPQKHVMCPAEKLLIVRAHAFFLKEGFEQGVGYRRHVRDLVHECLGFSKSVISRVVAQWRRDQDPTFAPREPPKRGHSPLSAAYELGAEIRAIVASPYHRDYHGNFTAQLFERWFKELCESLAQDHGTCVIHLDGAKYHKRVLNPNPTASWKKAAIQSWLSSRNVYFQACEVKAELLQKAKDAKEPPRFACVEVARSYGHRVLYTPPYHPELQPIEIIWAVCKNRVAADPAKDMRDLQDKLKSSLDTIHSGTWTGALAKVQRFEDLYLASANSAALVDDDCDDDDDSDGASDAELVDDMFGGPESMVFACRPVEIGHRDYMESIVYQI